MCRPIGLHLLLWQQQNANAFKLDQLAWTTHPGTWLSADTVGGRDGTSILIETSRHSSAVKKSIIAIMHRHGGMQRRP